MFGFNCHLYYCICCACICQIKIVQIRKKPGKTAGSALLKNGRKALQTGEYVIKYSIVMDPEKTDCDPER